MGKEVTKIIAFAFWFVVGLMLYMKGCEHL